MKTLRIHIWGGLGSQLYGWALAEEISCVSLRPICLVFHTGGVTRRLPDLDFLSSRYSIETIDDFEVSGAHPQVTKSMSRLRKQTKSALLMSRVVLEDSTIPSSLKIPHQTRSIRGHYSNRPIANFAIRRIFDLSIENGLLTTSPTDASILHYRLGDLLALDGKPPLEPKRFESFVGRNETLSVLSDSPDEAMKRLSTIPDLKFSAKKDSGPWDVLNQIVNAKTFIGTSSKLSFWGIAFRLVRNQNKNFITSEHFHLVKFLIEKEKWTSVSKY